MSKQKKVRDYVGHMHIYIIISAIMILCAIAGSLIFGVEVAIEFKGGTILNYSYRWRPWRRGFSTPPLPSRPARRWGTAAARP